MPNLDQRIAALEKRRQDAERELGAGIRPSSNDPAEAARLYTEIMVGFPWVPTAEEVRRNDQWHLMTAQEATQVYLAMMNDPHFDVGRTVDKIVAGRSDSEAKP